MKILVTNDDGIFAEGMKPLAMWAATIGEVTVVAPKVEQSAKSHGITLGKIFDVDKVELFEGEEAEGTIESYAVNSTPADCVRFAVLGLGRKFDLVVSGINRGFNMGRDIMYSGTVSAAYEAANLGLRAISVSTDPSYYPQATMHMDRVYQFLIKHDLPDPNVIYNVNIPPEAGPIRITRQGGVYYTDEFIPQGGNLYLPTGRCAHEDTGNLQLDTDATIHGCISISPLSLERTNLDLFYDLQKINEQ
jgi:5'-nucleotidase